MGVSEFPKKVEIARKNWYETDCKGLSVAVIKDAYERGFNRAYRLLRKQEPHLMTLNDVKNLKHNDVVWLEDYDKEDVIPAIVTPYGAMSDCIDFAISNRSSMVVEYTDYGSRWRCWTDKPHEEQRKEEKWNDD